MKDPEITSQISELLEDFAEVGLDSLLEEGLLKDIPIIGSFVKFAVLTKNVPNVIFLSKMKRFLRGIENISEKEKENFIKDLDSKPDLKSKVGECLVLMIDRLDDMEKTDILAGLFIKYVKNKIDLEIFRRLVSAIDIAFIEDIKVLITNPDDKQCLTYLLRSGLSVTSSTGVPTSSRSFSSLGNIGNIRNISSRGNNLIYIRVRISDLGELFVKLMND